jgi:hypothetical protein
LSAASVMATTRGGNISPSFNNVVVGNEPNRNQGSMANNEQGKKAKDAHGLRGTDDHNKATIVSKQADLEKSHP